MRDLRLLAIAALAVALLTGCTPSPDASDVAGSQPLGEACAAATASVDDAMRAFEKIDPADPAAAGQALESVVEQLRTAGSEIDNGRLDAVLTDLGTGFEDLRVAVESVSQGDLAAVGTLTQVTDAIGAAGAEFSTLCGP
ncbi:MULTISPECIES: hypothetical protein [unclassified Microbacterium]|uniref:hypothetical protein n=1 Tax=unclassified Microbacterium TaxID=2609290 RepID=UPI00386C60D3